MMLFAAFGVIASVAVSAKPVERDSFITVPLTYQVNITSASDVVNASKSRLDLINNVPIGKQLRAGQGNGKITNIGITYVAPTTIGGKIYQLLVDTGSSLTWAGSRSPYVPGPTAITTNKTAVVTYGSGSFYGKEYFDTVSFGGLTVVQQAIGGALFTSGFSDVDGILGLGPTGLTADTVENVTVVPTLLDNLKSQGSIKNEVLGVWLRPLRRSSTSDTNGELTLGGVDTSRFTGDLIYHSTLKKGLASNYWGISVGGFAYGNLSLSRDTPAIVDTGTTLIYIPSPAYRKFLNATNGITDQSTGFAVFSERPTQNFTIKFGSTAYTLTPDQYLIPAAQYANLGLARSIFYAWINDGGDPATSSITTVIGQKFLENYYSVFDTDKARIGFAPRA